MAAAATTISDFLCVPEDAASPRNAASKETLCVPEDAVPTNDLYIHTPSHGALTTERVAADLEGQPSKDTFLSQFRHALTALPATPVSQDIWIIHCLMSETISYSWSSDCRPSVTYNAMMIDNYGNTHDVYNFASAVPWQQHCTGRPAPTYESWCKSLKENYPDKYKFPLTDRAIDLVKALPVVMSGFSLWNLQLWFPLFATFTTTHALAARMPDALRREEERRKDAARRELEGQIAALQEKLRAL